MQTRPFVTTLIVLLVAAYGFALAISTAHLAQVYHLFSGGLPYSISVGLAAALEIVAFLFSIITTSLRDKAGPWAAWASTSALLLVWFGNFYAMMQAAPTMPIYVTALFSCFVPICTMFVGKVLGSMFTLLDTLGHADTAHAASAQPITAQPITAQPVTAQPVTAAPDRTVAAPVVDTPVPASPPRTTRALAPAGAVTVQTRPRVATPLPTPEPTPAPTTTDAPTAQPGDTAVTHAAVTDDHDLRKGSTDARILRALAHHGELTNEQLAQLTASTAGRVSNAALRLFQRGTIQRGSAGGWRTQG